MRRLLDQHDLVLIEASVIERLRRGGRVELHPRLVHAHLLYDESGRRELRGIFQGYIDGAVDHPPLGFMVNCAHPTFLSAGRQPRRLLERLIGYQANAADLDHAELDGLARLEADEVSVWGDAMLALHREQGIKILGGCCGTGVDHLAYLVDKL